MLDPHVSLRAVAEAPLDFDLHRESLQQASRSRSERWERAGKRRASLSYAAISHDFLSPPCRAPHIPSAFDLGSGVVEPEEQRFSNSSRMRPLKLSQKPFGMGFPGAM